MWVNQVLPMSPIRPPHLVCTSIIERFYIKFGQGQGQGQGQGEFTTPHLVETLNGAVVIHATRPTFHINVFEYNPIIRLCIDIYTVRDAKMIMIRVLTLSLFIITLAACGKKEEDKPRPPTNVTAITVEPKTIPADFEYVGVAQSSHLVEIRARVEGYLDKIGYAEGAFVNQGDLLFQLDQKPFQTKLESAKSELAKQEAVLWNATRTKERLEPLFEKNAASRKDLDDAIARELAAQADVSAAKSSIVQAELDLGYTTILSPINGLGGLSTYREGALITPGVNGLLTTVAVINPIWVNFSVSESDLLRGERDMKRHTLVAPLNMNFDVKIILADGTTLPDVGRVNFADPSLNQGTGTMNVRAAIPNPLGTLRPGQFVRVKLIGAVRPNAIVVPQRAVLQGKKGMFVYIIDKEDKAQIRFIEAGPWFNDDWIIKEGLAKGDVVIVDGVNKIQNGSKVIVKDKIP